MGERDKSLSSLQFTRLSSCPTPCSIEEQVRLCRQYLFYSDWYDCFVTDVHPTIAVGCSKARHRGVVCRTGVVAALQEPVCCIMTHFHSTGSTSKCVVLNNAA